jgi:hypothetical protein
LSPLAPGAATPVAPPDRRETARALAVLLGAVGLAYANAFDAAFQFDDYAVIVDNPAVHSLSAWWASMPGIRPLLKFSYSLNWALAPQAGAFHAVNIGLHALNALLLWALARHWLAQLAPRRDVAFGALACAALFAVHPAATEAVTYASGRSIALCATCYLAALLADAHGRARGRHLLSDLGAPLLFAAALAVRETALTLPLALLLPAWCATRRVQPDWRRCRGHLLVLATAALAALATPGYQHFFAASLDARALPQQLSGQLAAHAYLATQPLLGRVGMIDPDLGATAVPSATTLLTALVLAGVLMLAWHARGRRPWLAFGIFWYLLQLAPSNSLLPRLDLANDRHLYLALPGPALIVAVLLADPRWRRAGSAALCALLLALGLATVRRNTDYRSEITLWQANVAAAPGGARGWTNLGYAWRRSGDLAAARRAYRCALGADPAYTQAVLNLAALTTPDAALPTALAPAECAAWAGGFDRP